MTGHHGETYYHRDTSLATVNWDLQQPSSQPQKIVPGCSGMTKKKLKTIYFSSVLPLLFCCSYQYFLITFWRPFVIRFVLCYQTVVCPVCDVGVLWPNSWVEWIKMPLGTEVGLGPGHIVLDGGPSSSTSKGHSSPPIFGRCLLWPTVAHLSNCWARVCMLSMWHPMNIYEYYDSHEHDASHNIWKYSSVWS